MQLICPVDYTVHEEDVIQLFKPGICGIDDMFITL